MLSKFLKYLMYLSIAKRLQKFDLALEAPALAQKEKFKDIISRNVGTEFGEKYSFKNIKTISDYRKAVPIKDYTGFKPYVDLMIKGKENILVAGKVNMFGVTSGSTAAPKFIPITRHFTVEYHNSHLIWMYNMVKSRSDSVIGSIFTMVSPATEGLTEGGIPYGSSSGKQYRDQSIPIRALHPIPYSAFLIDDIQSKYHVALAFALGKDIRVVNSVNPSTLVMIAKILADRGEMLVEDLAASQFNNIPSSKQNLRSVLSKRLKPVPDRVDFLRDIIKRNGTLTPKAVWPNICAINTWQGGNAPFYLSKVSSLWGSAPQRCFGLRATEGMFSIPLDDFTASAVLAVNGHFLEFIEDGCEVKEDSATLLAHELEVGKRYRVVITTSSGLYRYDLGDVVEVTGMRKNTPEVAFLHKAGGVLSITGEKVYEDQVVDVMSFVSTKLDYDIVGFSVTIEIAENVRYALIVELSHLPDDAWNKKLIDMFDSELKKQNIEYRDKRASGRLHKPVLVIIKSGSYEKHRDLLVSKGRHDGQIKPPHLLKVQKEGKVSADTHEFFEYAEIVGRFE